MADTGLAPGPDGVLVMDKPQGPTSHDVVACVRRLARMRRVGHTGTLDPFATGVLPLVLGRATRLARFLSSATKAYTAEIRLGITTDTDDAMGRPVQVASGAAALPSREAVESALAAFRGSFEQAPPAYSAKKVGGVRAYAIARRDGVVELAPVVVRVSRLDVEAIENDRVIVRLECSAGFYVRALARDLGRALGCGAHLSALRRTRSGEFTDAQALPLADVQGNPDLVARAIVPLEGMLGWMPGAWLTAAGSDRVVHGQTAGPHEVSHWDPAPPSPAEALPAAGVDVRHPGLAVRSPGGTGRPAARRGGPPRVWLTAGMFCNRPSFWFSIESYFSREVRDNGGLVRVGWWSRDWAVRGG